MPLQVLLKFTSRGVNFLRNVFYYAIINFRETWPNSEIYNVSSRWYHEQRR